MLSIEGIILIAESRIARESNIIEKGGYVLSEKEEELVEAAMEELEEEDSD